MKLGGMKPPTLPKIGKAPGPKTKIHPSAQPRIRLPQGNTGASDPEPFLPGVGKL